MGIFKHKKIKLVFNKLSSSSALKSFVPFLAGGSIIICAALPQTTVSAPKLTPVKKVSAVKTVGLNRSSKPKPAITKVVTVAAPAPIKTPVMVSPATSTRETVTAKALPVVVPSPQSSVSGLAPASTITPGNSSGSSAPTTPASQPTTTSYTSSNWSGYMANTNSGSYSQISGAWTIPQATSGSSSTSADSTWIGIGGVSTSDLIQVGTQNEFTPSGHLESTAFYEMLPSASINITSMTVSAGDSMTAVLNEISSGEWSISITDVTNGQSFSDTVSYTSSNSSAEWIEEDPSYSTSHQIPFDDYGTVDFAEDSAKASGAVLNLSGADAQPITMVNHANQPISTPSGLESDGASFNTTRNYPS
jgi:hypothetical protein